MDYQIWGYTFKAEKLESGHFMVIGRSKGKKPYPLHKLGTAPTLEEMVRRMKSWAGHVLATPVMSKVEKANDLFARAEVKAVSNFVALGNK
jgi:hypothetical protein